MNQPQDFHIQRSKALWYAQLELGFHDDGERTIMKHRKHHGPVRVQKMLWPEKTGVCHAILVHPPAGIAGRSFNFSDIYRRRRTCSCDDSGRENGIAPMVNLLRNIFI